MTQFTVTHTPEGGLVINSNDNSFWGKLNIVQHLLENMVETTTNIEDNEPDDGTPTHIDMIELLDTIELELHRVEQLLERKMSKEDSMKYAVKLCEDKK